MKIMFCLLSWMDGGCFAFWVVLFIKFGWLEYVLDKLYVVFMDSFGAEWMDGEWMDGL